MKRPGLFDGLRYFPAFLLIALGLGIGLSIVFEITVTRFFVNQVLVPRMHPVALGPGDWVEVGARGADRPVMVRHLDGSVTSAGQMRGFLRHFYQAPSFLVTGFVWLTILWYLARIWPREGAALTSAGTDA